ncbi:MAG: S-adenosylmethionine:tRNA ribosyltransferase-isomerase [Polyangiaceae bacterium]|jgi:S-adenosylmethionine:tRNA ribosyltransferase-isomerase
MTPAPWPRDEPLDERLLVVDPRAGDWRDARVRDLPRYLAAGDLLVLNDAATVPASLPAVTARGERVELRLAAHVEDEVWRAVLLGEGDWHTRTEHRPPPPPVARGETLRIAPGFDVVVEDRDDARPRLLGVRFSVRGAALWAALYRHGRPVQYAHVDRALSLWHVQTPFASRPWAVEMPSAGRPLTWRLLGELRARGVRLASLTHAAGLSSTGDPSIDAALPLPERFDVPAATVRAIAETRRAGARVVAAGTTVVRALEGSARLHAGELLPGEGTTDLRIDARFRPRVVDGLLTGLHELGSSHRELTQAFAPEPLLARAWTHAEARGYQDHEFGDVCLVLPRS